MEEKEILLYSNKILEIIKSNENKNYNSKKLFFKIINELIDNNFLKKKELKVYKAFLKDLKNVGYVFTSEFTGKIKFNFDDNLNKNKEFIFYMPTNQKLLRGNDKINLMKHSSSNRIYNEILLIINYNIPGYLKLNKYLEELYNKYFPYIAYIYPSNLENNNSNIISCTNTNRGGLSYKCIKYVYKQFPNFKGYL